MKNLPAFLFVSLLFSCTNSKTANSDRITPNNSKLAQASWLIGEWQNSSENGIAGEIWKKYNDSLFVGKSFFIKGGDTVSLESIKLEQQANELHYIPTVRNQNEGKPVTFNLISLTADKLMFENRGHDFPQTITYHQLSKDSLLAEISGMQKGEYRVEKFPMQRVK